MTFQTSSIITTCSNPQHHASIMTHDVLHTSMYPTTTSRRLLISLFQFSFSLYPSSMTFSIHCYVTYSSMTFQTSSIINQTSSITFQTSSITFQTSSIINQTSSMTFHYLSNFIPYLSNFIHDLSNFIHDLSNFIHGLSKFIHGLSNFTHNHEHNLF